MTLDILTLGNGKIGESTYQLSRLVGQSCALSCSMHPDRTDRPAWMPKCYATVMHFATDTVRARHARNLAADPADVAREIRGLPHGAHLRLNVAGDVMATPKRPDVKFMEAVTGSLLDRPDILAWGYTHAWRFKAVQRFRDSAPNLHLRASCDSAGDRTRAQRMGWRVAVIVDVHMRTVRRMPETDRPRRMDNALVCPEQTKLKPNCRDCRLCWSSREAIGFVRH